MACASQLAHMRFAYLVSCSDGARGKTDVKERSENCRNPSVSGTGRADNFNVDKPPRGQRAKADDPR